MIDGRVYVSVTLLCFCPTFTRRKINRPRSYVLSSPLPLQDEDTPVIGKHRRLLEFTPVIPIPWFICQNILKLGEFIGVQRSPMVSPVVSRFLSSALLVCLLFDGFLSLRIKKKKK